MRDQTPGDSLVHQGIEHLGRPMHLDHQLDLPVASKLKALWQELDLMGQNASVVFLWSLV